MNFLAITTSSARAGLAISDSHQTFFSAENENPRTHSDWVHVALEEGLKKTGLSLDRIEGVAVDQGPGSFTGIRVGFNLAKTFSFANRMQILAVPSLEILLSEAPPSSIAMLNAFRNKIYLATKNEHGGMSELECLPVQEATEKMKAARLVVGDVLYVYPDLLNVMNQSNILTSAIRWPSVEALADLARRAPASRWTNDWKSLTPLYLRGSEAEENAKQ